MAGALTAVLLNVRGRRDPRVLYLAACVGALLIAYVITPYTALGLEGEPLLVTANTRYAVPALICAAPLLAWVLSRSSVAVVGQALAAVAVVLGFRANLPAPAKTMLAWGAAVAALVAIAALAVAVARHRLPRHLRVPALAVALLAAILVLVAAGHHQQRVYAATPYEAPDPAVEHFLAESRSGDRIGVAGAHTPAGITPEGILFGPRFRNRVSFVGPTVDHLLRSYEDPVAYAAALRRGRYDWLMVGTGFPPRPHPREEVWARRAGFGTVAASERLILMRPQTTRP
jgi:hypothetical protein